MPDKKSKVASQKSQVDQLQQQVQELTAALQHERADAINLRRRHEQQIASLRTSVKAHVLKDLLPIIDNFERALKHVPASPSARHPELVSGSDGDSNRIPKQVRNDGEAVQNDVKKYDDFVKGIQGVVKQFETTLQQLGVERIKTVGEPFNPHYHEAVSMEEGDGKHEIVSEELQAGYKLGDNVIRHAMVRVKVQ